MPEILFYLSSDSYPLDFCQGEGRQLPSTMKWDRAGRGSRKPAMSSLSLSSLFSNLSLQPHLLPLLPDPEALGTDFLNLLRSLLCKSGCFPQCQFIVLSVFSQLGSIFHLSPFQNVPNVLALFLLLTRLVYTFFV